jgi:hypothetical protein
MKGKNVFLSIYVPNTISFSELMNSDDIMFAGRQNINIRHIYVIQIARQY